MIINTFYIEAINTMCKEFTVKLKVSSTLRTVQVGNKNNKCLRNKHLTMFLLL